jgi:hypothetical protein
LHGNNRKRDLLFSNADDIGKIILRCTQADAFAANTVAVGGPSQPTLL